MKNHHASRDREGRTTPARSRALRTPASVTGIAVVLTAAAIAQRPNVATHP